jgi:hypothetical protein
MTNRARAAAGVSALLMPVAIAVGDLIRMLGVPVVAAPDGEPVEQVAAQLAAAATHPGAFTAASWVFYVAAVLTIPMVILLWRLAVDRSPKWAWAGAVLGACSVVGQFVHLGVYFGATPAFAASGDQTAASQLWVDWSTDAFATAVFVPYLVGILLAPAVAAVALKRAGVIAGWGLAAVLVATVLFAVLGSTPAVTPVWAVLLIVGFAPAAMRAIRGGTAAGAASVDPQLASAARV